MTHLHIQELKSIWMISCISDKIQFKIITSQMSVFQLEKKAKKFKWMDEAEKAFNEITKLLVSSPVLKAPTPDGLFRFESDTLREGVGGTLLQK